MGLKALVCAGAVVVLAASGAAARAGDIGGKESLEEGYLLARCAASGWQDAKSFDQLLECSRNAGRQAAYLVERYLVSFHAWSNPPQIVPGRPEDAQEAIWAAVEGSDTRFTGLGEATFWEWVSRARSGRDERHHAALRLGGFIQEEDAAILVALLLNDRSFQIRAGAAAGLDLHRVGPQARDLLPFLAVHVVLDPVDAVRRQCAQAIGPIAEVQFPMDGAFPGEVTVQAARDWVREHYDVGILEDGTSALDASTKQVGAAKQSIEEAYWLARCAASAWEDDASFEQLLRSTPEERRQAHYLLSSLLACTARTEEEPPVIVSEAPQGEEDVPTEHQRVSRRRAEEAQRKLSALHEGVFTAWATAVRSESALEREMAARSLSAFTGREEAVRFLVMLLNDHDRSVRSAAASALVLCAPSETARQALPFLAVHVLGDPDGFVRDACAKAIGNLSGERFAAEWPQVIGAAVGPARAWIEQHYDLGMLGSEGAAPQGKP